MKKSCLISCYDTVSQKLVIRNLKKIDKNLEIIKIKDEKDLLNKVRLIESPIIFFDKFFLGYVLKYKLMALKFINPKAHIVFVEQGSCPVFFGLRIHCLKTDGFICNIEDFNASRNDFIKSLERIRCFPKDVTDSLKNNTCVIEKNSCSEITEKEMEIALHMGRNITIKEIKYLMGNTSDGTISCYMNRIRKKIGYKNFLDLIILNKIALGM